MLRQRQPYKPDRKLSDFVKSLDVCIAQGWHGAECGGPIDPAHVKHETYEGANRKPYNRELPMCRIHHTIQGNMGEVRFYGDKLEAAKDLCKNIAMHMGDKEAAYRAIVRFMK